MTDKNDMGTEKEQEINGTPENCGEEKTETAPETETESDKTLTQKRRRNGRHGRAAP